MAFDVDRLFAFAMGAIRDFASDHADETFYGFAIDASLLCFNSVERFRETLEGYQERWPQYYHAKDQIEDLRSNPGDWEYQGFAQFTEAVGFDEEAYDDHYNIGLDDPSDPQLKRTEYALAMDEVIRRLVEARAFDGLKRTLDFSARRVEHNY